MISIQAPRSVAMVRPHHFRPNPETRTDNAFQSDVVGTDRDVATRAMAEFDGMVHVLREKGVIVHDFDDTSTETPDSVFPNNWFSTHAGGHVALYPMHTRTRRKERRWDIIEVLKRDYRVQDVIDFSGLEQDGLALEGTGAMVLDHVGRLAFVVRSNRADPIILERFCTHFYYEPIVFDARDATGKAVYHTNVLMTVATEFALVGLDMIADQDRRKVVAERLEESGHKVIALSERQIGDFCGNAFELSSETGRYLAISRRALAALTPEQIQTIEQSAELLPLDIPTIESAGGSVRCMIAGIHLARRSHLKREIS